MNINSNSNSNNTIDYNSKNNRRKNYNNENNNNNISNNNDHDDDDGGDVGAKGKAVRIILFATGGGLRPPQPPRFLKAIDGCKEEEQASAFMLALKEVRIILFANGGGCAPPNPPAFSKAIDACKKRTSVGSSPPSMLGLKRSIRSSPCGSFNVCAKGKLYADHFVCKWGGAAPPQPFRLLKAIDACNERTGIKASPPSMLALSNKHQVAAVWVIHIKLCCTNHFVLQMGAAAPIDACKKERASSRCRHPCLR